MPHPTDPTRSLRIIGMMSGTSYDSIDAAAADITLEDGTLVLTPLGLASEPYPAPLLAGLAAALPPAATTMEEVCQLDTGIGQAFARLAVRANAELCGGTADAVASHGQTVFHWVDGGQAMGTLQIGQPAWIAEATGCPVVSDFRPRDIAAGGQGAPLVGYFDALWLRGLPGNPVALNLGGIANITVGGASPAAFDTGPANALIDAAVRHFTNGVQDYDVDGALAAAGTVHQPLLERLLAEPYYGRPAPKTTGKELFHLPYLLSALDGLADVAAEDVVATLTLLTARTVAEAVAAVGGSTVIASGGGTRNPALMELLRSELHQRGGTTLQTSADLGLDVMAKEAYAFAVLGYLTLNNLTGTLDGTTGARHPSILGSVTPGRNGIPAAAAHGRAPLSLRIAGIPS
ncbi:anhydro-N-acetylmuramic acid kinase [Arthrobacter sp. 35W]|uniref:anhydro-N-acetylmuramic acid kinase n=1 Tax=Arthrobacter sp. 35W TaxID=1132441 RepID=UPI00041737E2|nr:anhydro-N-acetylmuramic acid kinase [Arthrobacter sp. 35W]